MLPFRKILCPVDYSLPSRAVVPYVKDLLRHFPADVVLVHAYGPSAVTALGYGELSMTNPNLYEDVRESEAERLHAFAQETFPGQHVETVVELGEPGCVIHKIARREGADLVMLATAGHGPVRRLLLGSVTAKVLHDVNTPVWTGIGRVLTEHSGKTPYESILCALDQSEEAEVVLRAAVAVADAYHARLSLLHVVETPVASPEVDFGPLKKQLVDAAHIWLRELKDKLGLNANYAVVDAVLPDAVCHEVIRTHADLVVTGRGHAQTTFTRMWSNLYAIVRESPCPVLSI